MTRRISQSITPTAEDVAALRGPFIAKGANDPVIAALREYFKASVPTWLPKLDEKQELTRERLAEIREAGVKRRAVIEALPEGKAREQALAELEQTEAVVEDMDTALAGAGAFGGN
ncbi:hypothetical protein SAMN02745947_05296 [Rhodococcus rhodochrous J3]|uniref:Uncharacterized protein n=2 Tax=Rhodococcus rhodochrous TaxID=1829 RepID=A0AAW4XP27_RHORH|nr:MULTISPECIES: hypothetical protein [Rhodococcus]MBF4476711.1 hypothetical protein [Rhodococcus rhodochrous]MCD2099997.1 hypothetical protein [Rhodococcus rhodochrous]MCD2114385.1 hypothetical protein [Rhodococcus rhodochrous]MCD2124395.1 hypothetical protein [Rhodococcus rhodochrous]MCQ4137908.1 hypothetical protein [Rhodococcus rhodochrous]